ncbi:MAG: hypothetical protein WDO15_15405 [Bacteroidota bacterium]
MKKLILFGMLILLIACEPGDLVNLPSEPERITILSYNQVGEPWFIMVTTTIPTTQRFPFTNPLPNAIVSIYEDESCKSNCPSIPAMCLTRPTPCRTSGQQLTRQDLDIVIKLL